MRKKRPPAASQMSNLKAYLKLRDKKQAFEWLEKGKQDRADGWSGC